MAAWEQTGDAGFLLEVLKDGRWHTLDEIIARSQAERGCGLTVHSRAATLRGRGYLIENDTSGRRNGRVVSRYRLVSTSSAPSLTDQQAHHHQHGAGGRVGAEDVGATSTGGSFSALSEEPPVQLSLGLPGRVLRKDEAA